MFHKYLLSAICALGPAASFAQSTPHLYVGVGAGLLTVAPFKSYNSSLLGPAATIGLAFSSRWAVQTGVQLAWRNNAYSFTNLNGGGTFDTYVDDLHENLFVVPLLARYTLTAPASRLHVDALGGFNWLYTRTHGSYSYTQNGFLFYDNAYKSSVNEFSLSLGPQVRYTLGTHLDLTASLPVHLNLNSLSTSQDVSNRLLYTPQLGAQYTFGR